MISEELGSYLGLASEEAALIESSAGAALMESSAAGLAWLFSTLVMTNARVMVMTVRANFIFSDFLKC